ncbi:hypothetical protein ABK040_008623 [Willaertia magna]
MSNDNNVTITTVINNNVNSTMSQQQSKPNATKKAGGKVGGLIGMFESIKEKSDVTTITTATSTTERMALETLLQEEEKRLRFKNRSNSFEFGNPNNTNSNNSISSSNNNNNLKQPFLVGNSNLKSTTSTTVPANNNNNQKVVGSNQNANNSGNTSLSRQNSTVKDLKQRFEKLEKKSEEEKKKEEEWLLKKKQRHLLPNSGGSSSNNNNKSTLTIKQHPEAEINDPNVNDVKRLSNLSSMSNNSTNSSYNHYYDHESIETESYNSSSEELIHNQPEEEYIVDHHEEDEMKQQVINDLMISPPPQIVKGFLNKAAPTYFSENNIGATTPTINTNNAHSPFIDSDISSPSGRGAGDLNLSNEDYLEVSMNRHQRYNISDLDLLTAYRFKSQIYQKHNPMNIMMTPFIQHTNVVLKEDEGDEYIENDESSPSLKANFHTRAKSSEDMIGEVLTRQDENEFTSWELQMEEFGKELLA